jgi:hypothetical protein
MRVSFLGRSRAITTFGAAVLGCGLLSAGIVPGVAAASAGTHSPKVLLVGSYKGKAGKYKTIQSAVNAARRLHPGRPW